MNIIKEFKGKYCQIKLRSDNILQIETMPDVEYGYEEAKIVISNILSIADNKQYYLLILSGEFSNVTVESMKILSTPQAMSYALAKAYVINSTSQKLMANYYLNVIKPQKPVQFFKDKESAEKWLLSIM